MSYLIAFIASILSYFILSLGFVLQKKGIHWLSNKEKSTQQYKTDRILWFVGLVLVNVAPMINFLALKELSSAVVTAVSGLNIIFTIFLSRTLLGSVIYASDYFYSGLIALSIAGIQLFSFSGTQIKGIFFPYFFQILPILLFVIYFLLKLLFQNKKLLMLNTILLSLIAGSMTGYMIILMKILQIQTRMKISLFFISPYFYFYLICGLFSFIAISMAYKIGNIMLISPIQYSSMVFYPFIASYCIFSLKLHTSEVIFFSVIILCVVLIIKNHRKEI